MNIFSKLIDRVGEYIDVRIRSIQLAFIERASFVLSHVIFMLIVILIAFGVLLFFGFGMAEYFSWLVDSRIGGFFLTMAMYLLLFFIAILFRKQITRAFAGTFIRVFTQINDKDEPTENNKQ